MIRIDAIMRLESCIQDNSGRGKQWPLEPISTNNRAFTSGHWPANFMK
jgi:hypothetical protein